MNPKVHANVNRENTMIINSSNVNSSTTASTKAGSSAENNSAGKASAPAKPVGSEKDSVSLSVQAQTLGRLEAKAAEAPDVDQAKVDAVKVAISEGRYQVNSRTVAEQILAQDNLLG